MRIAGPGGSWFGTKAAPLPGPWTSTGGLGWFVSGGVECATQDHAGRNPGDLVVTLVTLPCWKVAVGSKRIQNIGIKCPIFLGTDNEQHMKQMLVAIGHLRLP